MYQGLEYILSVFQDECFLDLNFNKLEMREKRCYDSNTQLPLMKVSLLIMCLPIQSFRLNPVRSE